MTESESVALPLGYTPIVFLYIKALQACQGFWVTNSGKYWLIENIRAPSSEMVQEIYVYLSTVSVFAFCVKSASGHVDILELRYRRDRTFTAFANGGER
jgi:hypothetical protein